MNCKTSILEEPFAPSAIVPPQIAQQLQSLVTAAVAPLLDEIAALKAEIADLKAGKATSPPPIETAVGEVVTPQQAPPAPDTEVLEEIFQLRADMEMFNESRALEIGQDRQRIAVLEMPPPPGPKTTAHIQHIQGLLRRADFHRSTVKFLASRLGLTKRRVWQIVHQMEGDGLVNLVWDPHHKGRKLVELRQQIGTYSEM